MACSRPLQAYRLQGGQVVFYDKGGGDPLSLPCGQCARCRLERSRQWAMRCMHECSLYDKNCFITLTYDDAHVPVDGSLRYRDFQLFMKRLRRRFSSRQIRFYMCGEYGDKEDRPHFHALLFDFDFEDKLYFKRAGEHKLYTSVVLSELWCAGHCLVGSATWDSASYIARYCMKKVTGDAAEFWYTSVDSVTGEMVDRVPEFNHMSLRPGIGMPWLERFFSDVYPEGKVVVNGRKVFPPKFYDKVFKRLPDDSDFALMKFRREVAGKSVFADNSDERLAVKEQVAKARLALKSRTL